MVPKKNQLAPGSEPTLNTRGFLIMKKLPFAVILVTSGSLKMWVTKDYHSCCLYDNCSKGESHGLKSVTHGLRRTAISQNTG